MDAFFYIDKPKGITSFDVIREMRKKFHIKKLGHTGTLDPGATGGMLVATGNYTKLIPFFEKDQKQYEAHIIFGATSPSFDADTERTNISQDRKNYFSQLLTREYLENILSHDFTGEILQTPPVYSALKLQGKTALSRTLSGEKIEMTPRACHIFSQEIISYDFPTLHIKLTVSAGTYIRSFAHELGEKIGCGAYLGALRRTKIGNISADMTSLEDLSIEKKCVVENLFPGKIFPLEDKNIYSRLQNGQRIRAKLLYPENRDILLEYEGNIVCVAEYVQGVLHPKKMIFPYEEKK